LTLVIIKFTYTKHMRDTRTSGSKGIAIVDRAGGKGGMQRPAKKEKPQNSRPEKRLEQKTGTKTRTPAPKASKYPGKSSGGARPGTGSKSGKDVKGDFTKQPGMHPAVMDTWTNPKTGETTSLTRGYKPKEGSGWEKGSGKSGPKSKSGSIAEEGRKKLAEARAKKGGKPAPKAGARPEKKFEQRGNRPGPAGRAAAASAEIKAGRGKAGKPAGGPGPAARGGGSGSRGKLGKPAPKRQTSAPNYPEAPAPKRQASARGGGSGGRGAKAAGPKAQAMGKPRGEGGGSGGRGPAARGSMGKRRGYPLVKY
jgi:hypothetical protein